jgi:hypothetical protein
MGPMAVLARWRDNVSAAGRKAVLAHSLAPLGGRATQTFGEPDHGNNEGSHGGGGSGVHRCCGGSGGGGGLENETVKEECVERVITHAR